MRLSHRCTTVLQQRDAASEKAKRKERELEELEEAARNPADDAARKRTLVEELVSGVHEQTERKQELEEELKLAMAPYKEAGRKFNMSKRAKKEMAIQLVNAKKRLQEAADEIAANAESAESEEARFTTLLRTTEEELALARANVDPLKENQSKWLRSYEELEPHVAEARSKVNDLKAKRNEIQNTLRSLQSSSGNDALALLGPKVVTLTKMVRPFLAVVSASQCF
jgi:chromosome segregation ATPase